MEIKKRMIIDASFDINYDPNDVDFSDWLASKFNNHKTMDRATKNVLWVYWMRGEDDEVESDNESSCGDSTTKDRIKELFIIDVDVFHYKKPLCKQFKEFNYLLQINNDILTEDKPRLKTDDDLKNVWYYEWNDQVPWVYEKPWHEH